jgi:hypothetical protein
MTLCYFAFASTGGFGIAGASVVTASQSQTSPQSQAGTSSMTHLYVGTFTTSTRFISFVRVYICGQRQVIQSYQKNRLG